MGETILKLSVIQPKVYRETHEERNLTRAADYVKQAAAKEANIIAFPECYPGPYSGPITFDPRESISKLAEDVGAYIGFGGPVKEKNKFYDSYFFASPTGEIIGEYRKTIISLCDEYLFGKKFTAGKTYDVIKTDLCNIGVSMCWEAFFPEPARVLALKGADLIVYPTGNLLYDYRENWKTVLWARAIENVVYVAQTQSVFKNEKGFSFIMSPERILGHNFKEGILSATLDLKLLNRLRKEKELPNQPVKRYKTMPGLLQFIDKCPASYKL